VSVGLPSDGSYGVPEGLVCGFPATSEDGEWKIVPDLEFTEDGRAKFDASIAELVEERDAVKELGLI